ncbi:MAG: hypothetical protein ABUT20_25015 [Bacteroidota bacterium]
MYPSLRKWLQVSLFNLLLVSLIGVVLRYKIVFSLPFIDQKYLLHGHSHFAFAGWISQALMALLIADLSQKSGKNYFTKYRWVLYANLLTAYGMLTTFPVQGYGFFSIVFSTLSVFVSYVFVVLFWKDLKQANSKAVSHSWFKMALLCNVVSSIGPFTLAYMMATKNIHQNWYLTSIYFFLHFQYNGWFFFACMGLLNRQFEKYNFPGNTLKRVFQLFAVAFVPTFFFSLLWWPVTGWLYVLVVIAAVCQVAALLLLIKYIKQHIPLMKKKFTALTKYLFILCGAALTIKLCLQTGSVIPSLSKLAFGFRPIVIGYLHLVLLGVISIFIISYILFLRLIPVNRTTITGILVFVSGIILNEALLMIQGMADINYTGIPLLNPLLLIAAIVLFGGLLILNYGLKYPQSQASPLTED